MFDKSQKKGEVRKLESVTIWSQGIQAGRCAQLKRFFPLCLSLVPPHEVFELCLLPTFKIDLPTNEILKNQIKLNQIKLKYNHVIFQDSKGKSLIFCLSRYNIHCKLYKVYEVKKP